MNKIIEMANMRMAICRECPVYNSTTRTCGTPLNKLNPFAQPVTLDHLQTLRLFLGFEN